MLRLLGATLAMAIAAGCAPAPADQPQIEEPAAALRPEPLRGEVPAEARIADYELHARLDAEAHSIDGTARVTWRNRTSRTVDTLPFHLYMNGFRAEDTAWMRTSRGYHRRSSQSDEGAWGYVDVHSVRAGAAGPRFVADGVEQPASESIDLAWREAQDPSTMTVDLAAPVGPGEEVTVEIEFTTQLPRVLARTGYAGDFHAVGQWYPKIGVLEDEAGWQAHDFTVHDEFYADFGHYRVVLDVPERMIVGATGIRVEEVVADGRKRLTYEAEMVHDFAWMADPDFVEYLGEFEGIRIRQLIQPERAGDAEAHLAAQVAALKSYERRFGPYPWSTITIVHPPEDAEGAGGMEYATLFTTNDRAPLPAWVRSTLFDERVSGVFTTVHEFGHQYFQGMLASREHVEPWLDEGVDTTSNALAMMDRFGEDPWLVRILSQQLRLSDLLRAGIRGRGLWEPVDRPARAFSSTARNYGATVYGRVGALMLTLRNLAGAPAFDAAFRVYAERMRFRHPRGEDLEAILVAELGPTVNVAGPDEPAADLDVEAYLDQALRTTREVDFEVVSVFNRRRAGTAGWRRDADGRLTGGEPPPDLDVELEDLDDAEVEGVVVVRRAGAFEVPVALRVDFADGGVERLTWDAREYVEVFAWPGRRVRRATLDPDGALLLEGDRLDNVADARGVAEDDGAGALLGNLLQAVSLVLMGSLGP